MTFFELFLFGGNSLDLEFFFNQPTQVFINFSIMALLENLIKSHLINFNTLIGGP